MNKRERLLVIVTLVVVGSLLSYNFFFADMLESSEETEMVGDLDETRATFTEYASTYMKAKEIRGEYARIDIGIPERIGKKRPGDTFSDELYKMLTQDFGVAAPRMGTWKRVLIEDVDDYYFIEINVEIGDTRPKLISLLRKLNDGGLLIKSFAMDKTGRGKEQVKLDMTVARLVKHDKESRKIMMRKRR